MLKNIVGLNINMIIRCASSSQQQPISLQTILTILRRLKTRMGRTNKQNDDSRLAGFVVRDVIVPVIATNSSLSSWLDIWPCPHVLVFLLDPAQLGIAILLWYLILQLFIDQPIILIFAQQKPLNKYLASSQNYYVKIFGVLPASWCQMGRDRFAPKYGWQSYPQDLCLSSPWADHSTPFQYRTAPVTYHHCSILTTKSFNGNNFFRIS